MLKKLLSVILCLSFTVSLTACNFEFKISDILNTSAPQDAASFFDGLFSGSPFENDTGHTVSSPSVVLPDAPKTVHTPVSKTKYYQYSLLNEDDKALYNDICKGIETQQNYINVKKYNLTAEKLQAVLNKVIADNPQYFWLAKFMQYSITTVKDESIIIDLILFYTDGEVTDDFDDNGEFLTTADREKIKQQKIMFDNLAAQFLNTVERDATDIEKERLIHDFVLKTVTYAESESNKSLEKENYLRIYDVYGALVNNSAVCEGYTKLFQYLCYQAGLNSTFVYGTGKNESHSWNTVEIDGKWYHIDTTWDDGSTTGTPLYHYFNLTETQINEDHIIDDETITVPKATSDTHSFVNTFGVAVSKHSQPQNYQAAIDYLMKSDGKYLILVCDGPLPNSYYIRKFCFNLNCDMQKYIKVKGYDLSFKTSYLEIDNFIYLERT